MEFTFGAEHELADWDRSIKLPDGFGIDTKDVTIVNSNGIAVDPRARLYKYGGEVQTKPSDTIAEQLDMLEWLRDDLGGRINYRSNLHIHIGVPGLAEDLPRLKMIAQFIDRYGRTLVPQVEPMWELSWEEAGPRDQRFFSREVWEAGAKRRLRRCKVSHHTFIPSSRVRQQLQARTVQEFFEAEVPRSRTGKPLWHCQPRAAINLRQLKDTGTIEFRHWPGTLEPALLRGAFVFCEAFITAAYFGGEGLSLMGILQDFPRWHPYCHWMECRYRATCHDGTLSAETITLNIKAIEEGRWDDTLCMPR